MTQRHDRPGAKSGAIAESLPSSSSKVHPHDAKCFSVS
jgi:hypothetical protein